MTIQQKNVRSGHTALEHKQSLITRTDRLRLISTLEHETGGNACADDLRKKIFQSSEVEKTNTPRDLITMNTMFRGVFIENKRRDSNAVKILTLSYPDRADFSNGWISIMTPLGVELLGARKDNVVRWPEADGHSKKLLIDEIIYQPELNGDWKL